MALTSRQHCSRLQQSRCHAVINELIVTFAAYTEAETTLLFNGPNNPKICPFQFDSQLYPT